MRRPEEKVWVQVCLLDKYVATSSMIKTPRVPYGSREEIGGLAEKVAEDNSDLVFSLLSTLKNFNSIAIQSKCHCGIHAKSIFITVQKDFFMVSVWKLYVLELLMAYICLKKLHSYTVADLKAT